MLTCNMIATANLMVPLNGNVTLQKKVSTMNKEGIRLNGNSISYKGKRIQLDERNFFINSELTEQEKKQCPYVFQSVNEATGHLTDGTEAEPMTLYIAPGVYWIDNPDDPEVRIPIEGETPYGLKINCNGLRLYGLTDDPQDVVLACNRGQTQGAVGNFTMLRIEGNEVSAENITFGNYCNVDLIYPRNPKLNRPKRMDAIVQAQLVHCRGDKYVIRNCRFISRLNLCPFTGGKRTLFENCHFESTDDALCGTGVYIDCDFTFYSSKPFYATSKTGAVFFNCDINVLTEGKQYFTKVGSPVAVIDTRFHADNDTRFLGWTQVPTENQRNYQYGVSYNGKSYRLHPSNDWITIDMTDKEALQAYLIHYKDKKVYNTYNLLCGDDDWDPMQVKGLISKAEKKQGRRLTGIPTLLTVTPVQGEIESSVTDITLKATFTRFGNYASPMQPLTWSVSPEFAKDVELKPLADGSCQVTGRNIDDETKRIVVKATSADGLESASVITVKPKMLEAPKFIRLPEIRLFSEEHVANAAEAATVSHSENLPGKSYQQKAELTSTSLPKMEHRRLDVTDKKNIHTIRTDHLQDAPFRRGIIRVDYELDLQGRKDESIISWYRCTDAQGSDAVEVATSRRNQPEQSYQLSACDVGYYLLAKVSPKHLRCLPGETKQAITPRAIALADIVPTNRFYTDFQNFATAYQPHILPGFWTVDGYKPADTKDFEWEPKQDGNWFYGKGNNGASAHYGLLQGHKGARLLYTPTQKHTEGMKITLQIDPAKTAGQGFGSATGQYLDICLKFDPQTLSGYGLRIIRTPKNDSAVDFYLIQYQNGVVNCISKAVSASCYLSTCTVKLTAHNGKLTATATSNSTEKRKEKAGVEKEVHLEANIQPNEFGGVAIQHTGSTGDSASQLRSLEIIWEH